MSETHVDGQVLATCPECEQTTRLRPSHAAPSTSATISCGSCGHHFTAERETGEVAL